MTAETTRPNEATTVGGWRKSVLALIAAGNLVVGGAIGALWTDFSSWKEKQTEASVAAVTSVRDVDQELNDFIVKLAKVALAEGTINAEERADLLKTINKANQKAADLSSIYPSLKPLYEAYVDSLIGVKQASDRMKGPLTAKDFVRAVSRYTVARDDFRDAAQRVSSSYLRSFRF